MKNDHPFLKQLALEKISSQIVRILVKTFYFQWVCWGSFFFKYFFWKWVIIINASSPIPSHTWECDDHTVHILTQWHLTANWVYIYMTLLPQAGCDTRWIFRQNKAGLNSEFSFSKTGCLTKAKKHSLSYYLPSAVGWGEKQMHAGWVTPLKSVCSCTSSEVGCHIISS